MALLGDPTALRLAVERTCPVRRGASVRLGPFPTETAEDVSKGSEKVLQQVAVGRLSIEEGQGLLDLLEMRRRAIETEELERRLRALETKNENQ
jgi:hypothetical protein